MILGNLFSRSHTLTHVQDVADALLHFTYDHIMLCIRRALFQSSFQHSSRIAKTSGKSKAAHSKHQNKQTVRTHFSNVEVDLLDFLMHMHWNLVYASFIPFLLH